MYASGGLALWAGFETLGGMRPICGVRTSTGPCPLDRGECSLHPTIVGRQVTPAKPVPRFSPRGQAQSPSRIPRPVVKLPPALAERDIRGLAWWLFEQVALDRVKTNEARVLAFILKLLESLGPGGMERDDQLAEVARIGKLSLGIPPATGDEWDWVAGRFEDEAIEEFQRWATGFEHR